MIFKARCWVRSFRRMPVVRLLVVSSLAGVRIGLAVGGQFTSEGTFSRSRSRYVGGGANMINSLVALIGTAIQTGSVTVGMFICGMSFHTKAEMRLP
jgi:multisubunit Na+/H+ antiporter MnhB subunit